MVKQLHIATELEGLPWWLSGKESACQCKRCKRGWVQSLHWEDPLEKVMATYPSTLAWEIPQRSLASHSPWGYKESDKTELLTLSLFILLLLSYTFIH